MTTLKLNLCVRQVAGQRILTLEKAPWEIRREKKGRWRWKSAHQLEMLVEYWGADGEYCRFMRKQEVPEGSLLALFTPPAAEGNIRITCPPGIPGTEIKEELIRVFTHEDVTAKDFRIPPWVQRALGKRAEQIRKPRLWPKLIASTTATPYSEKFSSRKIATIILASMTLIALLATVLLY